jgi:hypothetical protein
MDGSVPQQGMKREIELFGATAPGIGAIDHRLRIFIVTGIVAGSAGAPALARSGSPLADSIRLTGSPAAVAIVAASCIGLSRFPAGGCVADRPGRVRARACVVRVPAADGGTAYNLKAGEGRMCLKLPGPLAELRAAFSYCVPLQENVSGVSRYFLQIRSRQQYYKVVHHKKLYWCEQCPGFR